MSEEYKMSEPLTNHNTVFVKNIEQENKDAQYREEFERQLAGYGSPPYRKNGDDQYYEERLINLEWKAYLAGRKKGEEELNMKDKAEIDPHSKCMLDEIEYKKEIESLKKEIEELKMKPILHKVSNAFREQQSEIDKLRELVDRAKPWVEGYDHELRFYSMMDSIKNDINQWFKEASEVLK